MPSECFFRLLEKRGNMPAKTHLYSLIDMLPETEIYPAIRYLEFLISKAGDPVVLTLSNAAYDDEAPEEDELRDVGEAEKDV